MIEVKMGVDDEINVGGAHAKSVEFRQKVGDVLDAVNIEFFRGVFMPATGIDQDGGCF